MNETKARTAGKQIGNKQAEGSRVKRQGVSLRNNLSSIHLFSHFN